jgi:hypothetical protein
MSGRNSQSDLNSIIIETPVSPDSQSLKPVQDKNDFNENFNNNNSSVNGNNSTAPEDDDFIPIKEIADFRKYYKNIKGAYNSEISYDSITLDLIAIYLKGQKVLYVESKTFCEQCLYYLMLPAIFISAVCTVISVSLKDYIWGSILVASLTGINSFILSVVTYLKLDAKSEAHRTASYQFDKLQTMCEFHSGKSLLVKMSGNDEVIINHKPGDETISEFVNKIEMKVAEIKDVNQFVIPEIIRHRYATIYGTNNFCNSKKI